MNSNKYEHFETNQNNLELKWKNPVAAEYTQQLISQIGLPSKTTSNLVVWERKILTNTCFERIEIRNTSNNNNTYVYVRYDMPISKYIEVTDLSELIKYDPLRRELRVQGPTLEICVAILTLAVQIGEGQISLKYAVDNQLLLSYYKSSQEYNRYTQLYNYLSYLLKHQQGNGELENGELVSFPMPVMSSFSSSFIY